MTVLAAFARRFLVPAALVAVVLALGCGGGKEFAPVEGRVTLDGRPLADAEVVFVPDPGKGTAGNNVSAFTDADGRYKLRSPRDGKDGAAPGFYRVTVTDAAAVADLTAVGGAPGAGVSPVTKAGPKPRPPAAYGDLGRTPFKDVEVKPGPQTLNFDLKGDAK